MKKGPKQRLLQILAVNVSTPKIRLENGYKVSIPDADRILVGIKNKNIHTCIRTMTV